MTFLQPCVCLNIETHFIKLEDIVNFKCEWQGPLGQLGEQRVEEEVELGEDLFPNQGELSGPPK